MGKKLLLAATVSMALVANAGRSPYQDKNYLDWGKLKLVGNQLSDQKGDPVQLKGWSTQSLHTKAAAGCFGQGQWKLMREYGANVVRLAMYIDDSSDGGSYLEKPGYFKDLIKHSIAETKNLNMYCIVDWHTTPDSLLSGDRNDYIAESKDFFGEISKFCADNGYDNVLYEICNESTCGWPNIKSYAEEVIPVITANQPDAIVIVGTDQWSQKIVEPMTMPMDSSYKKNVMYSFHYDACSHYALLGDFRYAQKHLPVFVSEWSAVHFNGDGPFCMENSDELISNCDNTSAVAPLVVSWCLWNWSRKNDASSFFTDSCDPSNLSKYMDESGRKYSDYVIELMRGPQPHPCCTPPDGPWSTINTIPSTEASLWHWDYYNLGGEMLAYHDANSSAYKKDDDGVVLGYKNTGEEVDVKSLAKRMQWTEVDAWKNKNEKECPWSVVEDGKVVSWDAAINTVWRDEKGNPTYKSLNAGRNYSGTDGSERPDEGVDLNAANLKGTNYENMRYNSLYLVEDDEWINYTVKVEKPGYYKIKGIISSEYKAANKNGEISIISEHGNHLRSTSALKEDDVITTFGFPKTTVCADLTATDSTYWNCWAESDAISGDNKEVLCVFDKAGEQNMTFRFYGDASGVGPLIFEFYKELDPEDPITGIANEVNADELSFTVSPNPTSGEFAVTLADNAEASVEVVNMAGQVVASQKIVGSASINKALPAGVYTVVVESNGSVDTQKLVVK
ncbi:MAG: cellulase family glycosylhydrolase [Paludibacteraceae bacterium]|nr:cellulase family glycosylhydrolase [Paludibacteraceae bacterium]